MKSDVKEQKDIVTHYPASFAYIQTHFIVSFISEYDSCRGWMTAPPVASCCQFGDDRNY